MSLSWNSTVKVKGDARELVEVASWLAKSCARWPDETLRWLIGDGPEPLWVALVDLIAADPDPDGFGRGRHLTGPGLLQWQAAMSEFAKENQDQDTWIHSADLDGVATSLQVSSPERSGRWTGFTIAVFDGPATGWVRFEPQHQSPCDSWVVVTSDGHVATLEAGSAGVVDVDVERRALDDPDGQPVQLGRARAEATSGSVRLTVEDVQLPDVDGLSKIQRRTRIKKADGTIEATGRGGHRLRIRARLGVRLRPFYLNVVRPVWPLARMALARSSHDTVAATVDSVMNAEEWPALVRSVRAESA